MSVTGINLPDQCSNYYELLGLTLFETDVEVVDSKVRSMMRDARKYQVGQFADQAEKCLDLLATARTCLLDPQLKRTYDDQLRVQLGLPPLPRESDAAADVATADPLPALWSTLAEHPWVTRLRERAQQTPVIAGCAIAVVLVVMWGSGLFSVTDRSNAEDPALLVESTTPAVPIEAASSEQISVSRGSSAPESLPAAVKPSATEATPSATEPSATRRSGTGSSASSRNAAAGSPPMRVPETGPSSRKLPRKPAPQAGPGDRDEADRTLALLPTPGNRQPGMSSGSDGDRSNAARNAAMPNPTGDSTPAPDPESKSAPDPQAPEPDPAMQPSPRPVQVPIPTRPPRINDLDGNAPEEPDESPDDLLKELKSLRLRYSRLSTSEKRSNRTQTWMRARRMVLQGAETFADDPRFQKQLEQESTALMRMFPELKDALKNISRSR